MLVPNPQLSALTDVSFGTVAQGDMPYRGASAWNNLPAGTTGQVLKSNGPGANPSWGAAGTSSVDLVSYSLFGGL